MAKKISATGSKRSKQASKVVRLRAPRSAQIRARIDPDIKDSAEAILEELGMTPSSAISTFYRQIVLRKGLPFAVEVPNAVTRKAMEAARSGNDLIEGDDLQDLLSKLLTKKARSR